MDQIFRQQREIWVETLTIDAHDAPHTFIFPLFYELNPLNRLFPDHEQASAAGPRSRDDGPFSESLLKFAGSAEVGGSPLTGVMVSNCVYSHPSQQA